MRLGGKVALITGAATGVQGELMGFGGAVAWLFGREGAKVVVSDIDDELGEKTAAQIRESGADALFVHLDVTSAQQWKEAIDTTVSDYGRLDVLVNNAGTGGRYTVEETTEEIWDDQMNLHAKGVFLGTKHAIPEMRKVGGGSIINVSSIYGIIGSDTATPYHAAKGASRILTKAAAVQYGRDNIRVNSVHPGFTWTPMTRVNFATERGDRLLASIPLGRFGKAEDIIYAILYLASDESSYVTGAELVVDGGVIIQ